MKPDLILGALLSLSVISSAAGPRRTSFTGEISDSQCAAKVHSRDGSHTEMLKLKGYGPTPTDCARTCVRQYGGHFVLLQPKGVVYRLEPQEKLDEFAGQKVSIEGSLDRKTKTIHVLDIKPLQAGSR